MTDRIFVENLHLDCRVGIMPEERQKAQRIVVDVALFLDLSGASKMDDVASSVNYKEVMERISDVVSSKEFNLVESVAEAIAAKMLGIHAVGRVKVRVRKEKYSLEPSVGVEVERVRG